MNALKARGRNILCQDCKYIFIPSILSKLLRTKTTCPRCGSHAIVLIFVD